VRGRARSETAEADILRARACKARSVLRGAKRRADKGGERIVTRSEGNVIYEIDGKPAVEVLKEYLPEQALEEDRDWMHYAVSLALCFKAPSYMKDEEYVVRGVPGVRMVDGSIIVQTEVSEGTSVWF